MIAVIADDITGAAEMAGIGLRYGLDARMITGKGENIPSAELLVCATDTRSMTELEAADTLRSMARELVRAGYSDIFKKTDSALRGHVISEIRTILDGTSYQRSIYLPENPSRGRILRDGVYYMDGQPLDRTVFANDPEFPANSAVITERIKGLDGVIDPSGELPDHGIYAANAVSVEDVFLQIAKKDESTLLAGGADLFSCYLSSKGYVERKDIPPFEGLGMRNGIIVCGSTTGHSLENFAYLKRKEIPVMTMPDHVFNLESDPRTWLSVLEEVYREQGSIVLAIGHPTRKNVNFAHRLRSIIALATSELMNWGMPQELIIEGGSTAFAILSLLGMNDFKITNEISPGVVRMKYEGEDAEDDLYVTVKPGSYSWGETLFQ